MTSSNCIIFEMCEMLIYTQIVLFLCSFEGKNLQVPFLCCIFAP